MKKFSILVFFVFLATQLSAQSIEKVRKYYNEGNYPKAIESGEKVLATDNTNKEALLLIAESYRLIKDYSNAEDTYSQLFASNASHEASEYYNYGMVLKSNRRYDLARQMFEQYYTLKPNANKSQLNSLDRIAEFNTPAKYTVQNVNINSNLAEFGAMFYKDGILFASENNAQSPKKYARRNAPFLDLFYAPLTSANNPSHFSKILAIPFPSVNTNYHESNPSLMPNGTVYYTTNSKSPKLPSGKRVLQIYDSNGVPVPFNSDTYSVGHPSLSSDGKTMYFTADIPGGYGGTDIYYSIRSGNTWSKPTNLGEIINTDGNEMFPYIAADGTLYFASDGHPGLGGLDIFSSIVVNNLQWSLPQNLHAPVNSPADDFSFIINTISNSGYFASAREGGKGNDDIYAFKPLTATTCVVKGRILDKATQNGVAGASVKLVNMSTGKETSLTTADGTYQFSLDPDNNYTIYVSKKGYFTELKPISTVGRDCSQAMQQDISLDILISSFPDDPIKIIAGTDTPESHFPKINHIYYDFDKADIRPDAKVELDKVVKFMKEYPETIIELGSHTDARGKNEYNLELSQRRAESAVNYIVSQGIDQNRLTAKGYGETQPVNKCTDGVTCTDAEHQQNRRTEFLIRFN